jgi:TPR repeat protein
MNNLKIYYNKNIDCVSPEEKSKNEIKKCYLKAIQKGDGESIYELAHCYKKIKNYGKAKKYYMIAVKKNIATQ